MTVTELRPSFGAVFPERPRGGTSWALPTIAAIYILAIASLVLTDYRSTLGSVARVNERTADLVAGHTGWVLENSLQTLNRAREIIGNWNDRDVAGGEAVAARLNDLVVANQAVGSIWAVDENALPLIDHTTARPAYAFAGDRPYFRVHAHGRETVWVGPAGMGTVVPRRRFTLSLPVTAGDRFAGVIVVGLDTEFFTRLYGLVEWHNVTSLALVSGDGHVLATWPSREEPRQRAADAIVAATRQIEPFPAQIVVSADISGALDGWRKRSAWIAGASALGLAAFGGLVLLGQRAGRERIRQSERRLLEAQRHARIGNWAANLATGGMKWSPTVFEIFGRDPRIFEPTLSSLREAVHPDDRAALAAAQVRAESAGSLDVVHRIVRQDGTVRHVHDRAKLIRDKSGRPAWLAGTVQDVTEEQRAKLALEHVNQLLASVIEHMPAVVFVKRASDLRYEQLNQAGEKFLGYPRSQLLGKSDYDLFPKEQADFFTATDRAVLTSPGAREIPEEPITLNGGSTRYLRTSKCALRDADGHSTHLLGVSLDITAQKEAEEKVQLLMREINHRAKNLLAVVQVMARHTAAESDPGAFTERFGQRLAALAACHDLLVRNAWRGVDMEELLRSQLAPFSDQFGTRVRLDGPAIRLSPQAAQVLGMAMHELATNAAKHGALSNTVGRISLAWQRQGEGDEMAIRIAWSEHEGPPVQRPGRTGFGSKILREMVELALAGKVTIKYESSGLVWTLVARAEHVLERGATGPPCPPP